MRRKEHEMIKTLVKIGREYMKWRGDWDALCNRCGKCCYQRSISDSGEVVVDYSAPCFFLDKETHLCSVFEHRFEIYPYCGSVNFFRALFYPLLPPDCAYVKTFRIWKK